MKKSEVKVGATYTAKVTDKVVPVRIDRVNAKGGWDATNLITNRPVRIKSAQRLRDRVADADQPDISAAAAAEAVATGNLAEGITVPQSTRKSKGKNKGNAPKAAGDLSAASPPAGRRKSSGRVSLATKADRDELLEAIKGIETSRGHIAFGKNGHVYELYFRETNGSPAILKVKASAKLDDEGYRSDGAQILQTGVDAVRQCIKDATGKTPSALDISLSQWSNSKSDGGSGTPAQRKRTGQGKDAISAIDAAARVLEEAGEPMNTKAMIQAMADKGYWSSDAATPHATLYSAILREIKTKGSDARFKKTERGKFALAPGSTAPGKEG